MAKYANWAEFEAGQNSNWSGEANTRSKLVGLGPNCGAVAGHVVEASVWSTVTNWDGDSFVCGKAGSGIVATGAAKAVTSCAHDDFRYGDFTYGHKAWFAGHEYSHSFLKRHHMP